MFIKELSQLTGVTAKTIRYYESIGLLPPPQRAENNYRVYSSDAVDRLRFIASIRALGFSLAEIFELLEAQANNQLHCHGIANSLDHHIKEIDRQIAGLLSLRATLNSTRGKARNLPYHKKCDEQCISYLLTVNQADGQIAIQKED